MEIGLIDIKGSLPCFENFGNLPTKIIDESNIDEIKDLNMLIIPGGSLIESGSLSESLKKNIVEFDGLLLGICSGFQILSEKIDIGRKSPIPIIKEGLGLLNVEFSPLICTDIVDFRLGKNKVFGNYNNEGRGFHCHTYGAINITNQKTRPLSYSTIKKLNYKVIGNKEILSGVYCNNVFGTMIHGFLDNEAVKNDLINYLKIEEDELKTIYEKNKKIKNKLILKSIILKNKSKNSETNCKFKTMNNDNINVDNNNNHNNNMTNNIDNSIDNNIDNKLNGKTKIKKGMVLLATGSGSGKTFLTTSIVSKLDEKTFVAKIGPDVRDIVPSLYILREPMTKYSSIKISDRGWCDVDEFLKFVMESDYTYYIIEGVMGAFTGALNKKNYSGAEISKLLGFPVYVVAPCNKSGIEGAFVESLSYCTLLKEMGVNVKGIILNKVYNFELFNKLEKICREIGINIIGVGKAKMEERGLMPEVEIDYENFCKNAMSIDIQLEIPKLNVNANNGGNNNNKDNSNNNDISNTHDFEHYLKKWAKKLKL
jgi:cobyric acid synthase